MHCSSFPVFYLWCTDSGSGISWLCIQEPRLPRTYYTGGGGEHTHTHKGILFFYYFHVFFSFHCALLCANVCFHDSAGSNLLSCLRHMHLFYTSSLYAMGKVCVGGNGWSPSLVPLEVESHLVSVPHWSQAERWQSVCLSSSIRWNFFSSPSHSVLKSSGLVSPWTSSPLTSRPRLHRSARVHASPQQQWNSMLGMPPTVHLQYYIPNALCLHQDKKNSSIFSKKKS